MVDAIEKLTAVGGSRAVLWVLAGNTRARRFYEAGGWKPDGEIRTEPVNGEPVDQLRYSFWLGGSARP
jgi:RimJ/RimL family protein N-acetyltransferase